MVVVGVDPQFPVRGVDMIFAVRLAARDQRQRLRRIIRRDEPHLVRRIIAGRDQDQALVVRFADADRETELLGLLVERDVLFRGRSEPVIARAVAPPWSLTSVKTIPALSLVHTGWPMPTSVTVSVSLPVARSRIRSWNRSDPS